MPVIVIGVEFCQNQPSEFRAEAKDMKGRKGIRELQPLLWLQDIRRRKLNEVDNIDIEMNEKPSSLPFQTRSSFHSSLDGVPADYRMRISADAVSRQEFLFDRGRLAGSISEWHYVSSGHQRVARPHLTQSWFAT